MHYLKCYCKIICDVACESILFYILFRLNLLLLPGSHDCVGVAVSTLDASADKSILTGAVIGNYALKEGQMEVLNVVHTYCNLLSSLARACVRGSIPIQDGRPASAHSVV